MTNEETERALQAMEQNGFYPVEKQQGQTVEIEAGRLFNLEKMKLVSMMAELFSKSSMVKEQFRGPKGSPGHANCFLALSMALELDIPWMTALTQIYCHKGNVGFPGQMLIALANKRAPIKGPIKYREKGKGEELEVTAYAIDRETGEEVSYPLSLKEARDAGATWGTKGQWKDNARLRLRYRAATYLIRSNYPDAIFGLYSTDELQVPDPETVKNAESINEELKASNE